jgi:hypothetical protein
LLVVLLLLLLLSLHFLLLLLRKRMAKMYGDCWRGRVGKRIGLSFVVLVVEVLEDFGLGHHLDREVVAEGAGTMPFKIRNLCNSPTESKGVVCCGKE